MITQHALPRSRTGYVYCPQSSELLGKADIPLSPETGTYPLPAHTTLVAPEGSRMLFQRHRYNTGTGKWELVDDYRFVLLYGKATAQVVANTLQLGDALPDDVTTCAPISVQAGDFQVNMWDGIRNAWALTPDYGGVPLWHKENGSPVPGIASGSPLPGHLTTVRPPLSDSPQEFDAVTGAWRAKQ